MVTESTGSGLEASLAIAVIGLVAFFCQWIAWRVRLPAILFLLLSGLLVGPGLGWIAPDELLGDLLFPLVSLAVAIILFEGALTLKLQEIRELQDVVQRLVTIGAIITWITVAVITHYIMGFSWQVSLLFGTLTSVTGPTVIMPLLRTVRPNANVGNILRWEGIVIDPIGALLAVLTYEMIVSLDKNLGWIHTLELFAMIMVAGTAIGWVAGYITGYVVRHQKVPEFLQNIFTLGVLLFAFVISNRLAEESGLLAVTVMGFVMANMKDVKIEQILHFKENLTVLLISGLFILLAARIQFEQVLDLGVAALVVLAIIQFIIRPLAILVSSFGSNLNWRERAFLSWIAPRGIVAAAISALFAERMTSLGYSEAQYLVPLTFLVIIGTVVIQSATARPLAVALGIAEPAPKGFLIIGANPVAQAIGKVLKEQGVRVLLADSNRANIRKARVDGLDVFYGNALSSYADSAMNLAGIGKLMGLSTQSELNTLACMRFKPDFGEQNLYALVSNYSAEDKHQVSDHHRGSLLFGNDLTYNRIAGILAKGGEIRVTGLTDEFTFKNYIYQKDRIAFPMFAIDPKGELHIFTQDSKLKPESDWKVIGLIQKHEQE
ncbi:MAG: sodium:proton antiporter [Pseudomonadota bacterium]|nr:sodium:proton antiporter [Pseudomonadota bacterium]